MAHTLDEEVLADNPTPFKIEFLMGPDGKPAHRPLRQARRERAVAGGA
jgi:hypothetical protein